MNEAEFYLEDLRSKFDKIDPDKYYLAYSGGRDSHFLLWFIREYLHETRIMPVFSNTGMDLPEIRERALANAEIIVKPTLRHTEIKEKYGIPLNSKMSDEWIWRYQDQKAKGVNDEDLSNTLKHMVLRQVDALPRGRKLGKLSRFAVNKKTSDAAINGSLHKVSPWCCKYLKKEPSMKFQSESGRKPILGIMGDESMTRKARFNSCFRKNGTFTPLWDLTEDLRNRIEAQFEIPVPHIYNYVNQTGCAGCPYGQHGKNPWKNTDIELSSCGEGQRNFILNYFRESYEFKGYHFNLMAFL